MPVLRRHGDDAEEVGEYARELGRRVRSSQPTSPTRPHPPRSSSSANGELGAVDILVADTGTAT